MSRLLNAIRTGAPISSEFRHALDQQVMKTEQLRIKVMLFTFALLVGALTIGYTISPAALDHIWSGRFELRHVYAIFLPFFFYECVVFVLLSRQISRGDDLPFWRRYGSALVETSLPSVALVQHIDGMDRVTALGFVAPFAYFIFIILSTLRLDFWL